MQKATKSQNKLLLKLVEQHDQIIRCEMELDDLQEQKQQLLEDWFAMPGSREDLDDVEGYVLLHEDQAYVIHLSQEEGPEGQPHYAAEIQRMKLIKSEA